MNEVVVKLGLVEAQLVAEAAETAEQTAEEWATDAVLRALVKQRMDEHDRKASLIALVQKEQTREG